MASLDGRRIGGELPGPLTGRLGELYGELVARYAAAPMPGRWTPPWSEPG